MAGEPTRTGSSSSSSSSNSRTTDDKTTGWHRDGRPGGDVDTTGSTMTNRYEHGETMTTIVGGNIHGDSTPDKDTKKVAKPDTTKNSGGGNGGQALLGDTKPALLGNKTFPTPDGYDA